nr:MAG TPA: hypothetical protein [Caudoviricetes sp.]
MQGMKIGRRGCSHTSQKRAKKKGIGCSRFPSIKDVSVSD